MLSSEYSPKEEYANVRRLGEFGEPNYSEIYGQSMANHPSNGSPAVSDEPEANTGEEVAKERKPFEFNPAIFSLILLAVGAIIIATGILITFGLGWGLTTLGVLTFAVGFMTAMNS